MQVPALSLVLAKFGAAISADLPAATVLVMIVCPATAGPAVTAIATVNTLFLSLLLTRVPVKDHDPSAVARQMGSRKASGALSEVETSAGSDALGAGDPDDDDDDGAGVAAVLLPVLGVAGPEPPLEHPASTRSSTAGSSALCFIVPPDSRHCCHGLQ